MLIHELDQISDVDKKAEVQISEMYEKSKSEKLAINLKYNMIRASMMSSNDIRLPSMNEFLSMAPTEGKTSVRKSIFFSELDDDDEYSEEAHHFELK